MRSWTGYQFCESNPDELDLCGLSVETQLCLNLLVCNWPRPGSHTWMESRKSSRDMPLTASWRNRKGTPIQSRRIAEATYPLHLWVHLEQWVIISRGSYELRSLDHAIWCRDRRFCDSCRSRMVATQTYRHTTNVSIPRSLVIYGSFSMSTLSTLQISWSPILVLGGRHRFSAISSGSTVLVYIFGKWINTVFEVGPQRRPRNAMLHRSVGYVLKVLSFSPTTPIIWAGVPLLL